MTARNVYATLAEYKAFVTARGQPITIDAADDVVIDGLLEAASRYIDTKTSRWFYPRIETRYYSLPGTNELDFDADLLAVITFLNGNGASIASTAYNLHPANDFPKYALNMKSSSGVTWAADSDNETEDVLDLTAIFGYHEHYTDGWKLGSTLNEDIDISELPWTVTSGTLFSPGQILKCESEIVIVDSKSTNDLTMIARGANGSTAATHANGTEVYYWQAMEEARNACLEIAMQAYKRRFGTSTSNTATVTGAGVVLTPRDIPALAADFINAKTRYV